MKHQSFDDAKVAFRSLCARQETERYEDSAEMKFMDNIILRMRMSQPSMQDDVNGNCAQRMAAEAGGGNHDDYGYASGGRGSFISRLPDYYCGCCSFPKHCKRSTFLYHRFLCPCDVDISVEGESAWVTRSRDMMSQQLLGLAARSCSGRAQGEGMQHGDGEDGGTVDLTLVEPALGNLGGFPSDVAESGRRCDSGKLAAIGLSLGVTRGQSTGADDLGLTMKTSIHGSVARNQNNSSSGSFGDSDEEGEERDDIGTVTLSEPRPVSQCLPNTGCLCAWGVNPPSVCPLGMNYLRHQLLPKDVNTFRSSYQRRSARRYQPYGLVRPRQRCQGDVQRRKCGDTHPRLKPPPAKRIRFSRDDTSFRKESTKRCRHCRKSLSGTQRHTYVGGVNGQIGISQKINSFGGADQMLVHRGDNVDCAPIHCGRYRVPKRSYEHQYNMNGLVSTYFGGWEGYLPRHTKPTKGLSHPQEMVCGVSLYPGPEFKAPASQDFLCKPAHGMLSEVIQVTMPRSSLPEACPGKVSWERSGEQEGRNNSCLREPERRNHGCLWTIPQAYNTRELHNSEQKQFVSTSLSDKVSTFVTKDAGKTPPAFKFSFSTPCVVLSQSKQDLLRPSPSSGLPGHCEKSTSTMCYSPLFARCPQSSSAVFYSHYSARCPQRSEASVDLINPCTLLDQSVIKNVTTNHNAAFNSHASRESTGMAHAKNGNFRNGIEEKMHHSFSYKFNKSKENAPPCAKDQSNGQVRIIQVPEGHFVKGTEGQLDKIRHKDDAPRQHPCWHTCPNTGVRWCHQRSRRGDRDVTGNNNNSGDGRRNAQHINNNSSSTPMPTAPQGRHQMSGRVVRVEGDGRCLFRSLATAEYPPLQAGWRDEYGRPSNRELADAETARADNLRARVVALMADNLHFYSQLERGVINADQPVASNYQRFMDRLRAMSHPTTMPGDLELNAAALVMERQIIVLDTNLAVITTYGRDRFPQSLPLAVRYTRLVADVGHYDAVILEDGHRGVTNGQHDWNSSSAQRGSPVEDSGLCGDFKRLTTSGGGDNGDGNDQQHIGGRTCGDTTLNAKKEFFYLRDSDKTLHSEGLQPVSAGKAAAAATSAVATSAGGEKQRTAEATTSTMGAAVYWPSNLALEKRPVLSDKHTQTYGDFLAPTRAGKCAERRKKRRCKCGRGEGRPKKVAGGKQRKPRKAVVALGKARRSNRVFFTTEGDGRKAAVRHQNINWNSRARNSRRTDAGTSRACSKCRGVEFGNSFRGGAQATEPVRVNAANVCTAPKRLKSYHRERFFPRYVPILNKVSALRAIRSFAKMGGSRCDHKPLKGRSFKNTSKHQWPRYVPCVRRRRIVDVSANKRPMVKRKTPATYISVCSPSRNPRTVKPGTPKPRPSGGVTKKGRRHISRGGKGDRSGQVPSLAPRSPRSLNFVPDRPRLPDAFEHAQCRCALCHSKVEVAAKEGVKCYLCGRVAHRACVSKGSPGWGQGGGDHNYFLCSNCVSV